VLPLVIPEKEGSPTSLSRRRNYDYSPRSVRERVFERRRHFIHRVNFERTYHGRTGNRDPVRPFLPSISPYGASLNTESLLSRRHVYMIISEVVTLGIYAFSLVFLPEYFGPSACALPKLLHLLLCVAPPDLLFVVSTRFGWKVAVIVAMSALPLWMIMDHQEAPTTKL
jgi:hypothetical protein